MDAEAEARIAALEKRVADLEARQSVRIDLAVKGDVSRELQRLVSDGVAAALHEHQDRWG